MTTLEYYFENGTHVKFEKYTIDTYGIIRNNKSGKTLSYFKKGKYNTCKVYENCGKSRQVYVGRALMSTFIGRPPTHHHTSDHVDRDPNNDTLENLRWLCKSGQRNNQERSGTLKSALLIVKDGIEKTAKEWTDHFKHTKNHIGHGYTASMILSYSQKKQHGFSYKEYRDLPGEVWKKILGSKTNKGSWEISDMSRVKYVTKYAENVFEGCRIGLDGMGYPLININGKRCHCHTIAFSTFFPYEYAAMKPGEMILHADDDKMDFRPCKLRIGNRNENAKDAHYNGKYDGKKTVRVKCASYVDGVFEKEYESQSDAERYLKTIGFEKATYVLIGKALEAYRDGKDVKRYKRTWKTSM